MKASRLLRITSGVFIVVAAVTAGYTVYHVQRKEPVIVATHKLQPYSVIQPSDVKMLYLPVSAVQPDAFHSTTNLVGHMTNIGVLPGAQMRAAMINPNNSLQSLINTVTKGSYVTFGITYNANSIDQFVQPGAHVDLIAQGPNNTILRAEHVLVMKNTGYVPNVGTSSKNASSGMLVMTLPEQTYLSMAQNIASNNVQVLMIAQSAQSNTSVTVSSPGIATTNTTANATTNAPTNTAATVSLPSSNNTSSGGSHHK